MSKPRVLILGGCGFVGRNLVGYLVKNDLCSFIRASDKSRPEMAWFSPQDKEIYSNPIVDYMMSNLVNEGSVSKTFDSPNGEFDFVINLASNGPYGEDEEFYAQKLGRLAQICGNEAKKRNIKKWIEVSTAQVYKSASKPVKENASVKPWTSLAQAKLNVENILKQIGLPLVIVRPSIIYGPGDVTGLMPRLVIGAVYKKLGEEMKLLWSGSLQINTVHVFDVVRALWVLVEKAQPGSVYNLSDQGATNQEKVNKAISEIYGIKTGFVGTALSNIARLNFNGAVEGINEKHMKPWGEISKEHGIDLTPLSPFLEKELLSSKDLSVDGNEITKLGFKYDIPAPTTQLLRESLNYWIDQKYFPPI